MVAQMMAFAINLGISSLTPYIVKYVGEEAYGFVGLANNFTGYATIITTALNSMAGRFITLSIHRGEHEDTSKYFTSVVMANLFISFFLTIAGGLVLVFLDRLVNVPGNILSDVTLLWALLFASFIIGLVGNVFGVATFARNRLELSSLQRVISNVINAVILVVAFLLFQPHVWYLGLSAVVCGLYTIGTNVYYTKSCCHLFGSGEGTLTSKNKNSGLVRYVEQLLIHQQYVCLLGWTCSLPIGWWDLQLWVWCPFPRPCQHRFYLYLARCPAPLRHRSPSAMRKMTWRISKGNWFQR